MVSSAPTQSTRITGEFSAKGDSIRGSSGCNRYHGSVAVQGSKLSLFRMILTAALCSDESVMERRMSI